MLQFTIKTTVTTHPAHPIPLNRATHPERQQVAARAVHASNDLRGISHPINGNLTPTQQRWTPLDTAPPSSEKKSARLLIGGHQHGRDALPIPSGQTPRWTMGITRDQFTFPLTPGKQHAAVSEALKAIPIVRLAVEPQLLSFFYYREPSTRITTQLIDFYGDTLLKRHGKSLEPAQVETLQNLNRHLLARSDDFQMEVHAWHGSKSVDAALQALQARATPKDYDDLLKHLFGASVGLTPGLSAAESHDLVQSMVSAARNSPDVEQALRQMGQGSKTRVQFGLFTAPNISSPDIARVIEPLHLSTHQQQDAKVVTANVDRRFIAIDHRPQTQDRDEALLGLQTASLLVLRAAEKQSGQPILGAPEIASQYTQTEQALTLGLLPSQLSLPPDNPLLQARKLANQALALAKAIDTSGVSSKDAQSLHHDLTEKLKAVIDLTHTERRNFFVEPPSANQTAPESGANLNANPNPNPNPLSSGSVLKL